LPGLSEFSLPVCFVVSVLSQCMPFRYRCLNPFLVVFCIVMPCGLDGGLQCFGETYCFHLQGCSEGCQGLSHVTVDGLSVSPSWYQASLGTGDQIFQSEL
jgi:hypothetical protein